MEREVNIKKPSLIIKHAIEAVPESLGTVNLFVGYYLNNIGVAYSGPPISIMKALDFQQQAYGGPKTTLWRKGCTGQEFAL